MPVAAAAAELVRGMHGEGYDDIDFAALLELEARASGLDLRSEDVDVGDGLEPAEGDGSAGLRARVVRAAPTRLDVA